MDGWHISSRPKHSSLFTSTRGVYQLLQIQIYVSVLQNGWVTLGQFSIKASTRVVYQLIQI